jgi:hypothetical protein
MLIFLLYLPSLETKHFVSWYPWNKFKSYKTNVTGQRPSSQQTYKEADIYLTSKETGKNFDYVVLEI